MALTRFPGRNVLIVILNGSMGLPPVVVGLVVFLLLSRSGPLGPFGILFTPQAMIIAQAVLIAPIIAALTRQVIEDLWAEYREELTAMDVGRSSRVATLLWDARFSLVTILLAGFGRAAAEVGAVMIVGGNIDGFTRVMTTTIALETSKGNLSACCRARARADRRDPFDQCAGMGGAGLVRAPCGIAPCATARPRFRSVSRHVAFTAGATFDPART